jgi:hypothetical protein
MNRPAGSRYFEVACASWQNNCVGTYEPQEAWGCGGTSISGADGILIGTGEQNTTDIVGECTTSGIAARLAYDLVLGGQSDWFLPSKDELNALCKWAFGDTVNTRCNDSGTFSLTGVGGFSVDLYWSSSEVRVDGTWTQSFNYFDNGYQFDGDKSWSSSIRPVRAF